MKGIKMSECRFYVNEAERTIVCVIPDTADMLVNYMYEHFRFRDVDLYYATDSLDGLLMPNSFMGKAVCSKDDEWDEELGRMIAFSRAKDKCYKSFFRRANTYVQTIDRRLGEVVDSFNEFGIKLEDKRENLQLKIEERVKE